MSTMHPEKEHLFKIVTTAKAKELLEYLNDHNKVRYKDLNKFINPGTLNNRLHEFYSLGFITYTGKPKRKLYEITEKGIRHSRMMRCLFYGLRFLIINLLLWPFFTCQLFRTIFTYAAFYDFSEIFDVFLHFCHFFIHDYIPNTGTSIGLPPQISL